MPRPIVLIVGGRGTTATRLRAQLSRRGLRVRNAGDCGTALELLNEAHERASSGRGPAYGGVILDPDGAGVGANAFREMVGLEFPDVALLELPAEHAGPEDVGLLVAAVEQQIREQRGHRTDQEAEGYETPLHGYKFEDLNSRSPAMLDLFNLIRASRRPTAPC